MDSQPGNGKLPAKDASSRPDPACTPGTRNLNFELTDSEVKHGKRTGDVYLRVSRPYQHMFRRIGPGHFVAMPESDQPGHPVEKGYRLLKRVIIGRPLETSEEINQRLTKLKAVAVFGSDAISSSAYATEAALVVLMAAGNGALGIAFLCSVAIAVALSVVSFSYRQTVHAYPHGGGSYNVSRENLGQTAGLIAAAALLIDYVLTVAVSIVAGSAAVTSALIASGLGAQLGTLESMLPSALNLNVILSLFFIGVITLGNLRGIRESGTIFAVPTYLFIVSLSTLLVAGLLQVLTGQLHPATPPPALIASEPIGIWLVLRAFSAGAVAMSGTEAISNGVPIFQKPEPKNAATTLTVMAALLGLFFLGVSFLSMRMGLVPGEETIISQIARAVFGMSVPYYIFQIATTGVLVIAANTAFADFPRLASVLARDNFMPHQFLFRGDRLSFSTGIIALGAIAALLVVAFGGKVDSLIHLYAVGVFLAFCFVQLRYGRALVPDARTGLENQFRHQWRGGCAHVEHPRHRRHHQVRARGLDRHPTDPDHRRVFSLCPRTLSGRCPATAHHPRTGAAVDHRPGRPGSARGCQLCLAPRDCLRPDDLQNRHHSAHRHRP